MGVRLDANIGRGGRILDGENVICTLGPYALDGLLAEYNKLETDEAREECLLGYAQRKKDRER